jgi:hypothetical protein
MRSLLNAVRMPMAEISRKREPKIMVRHGAKKPR